MKTTNEDWRLNGQESHLSNVTLYWMRWELQKPDWDHDHCAFCWTKFAEFDGPEILHEGYATEDRHEWVCQGCVGDFRQRFGWSLIGGPLGISN